MTLNELMDTSEIAALNELMDTLEIAAQMGLTPKEPANKSGVLARQKYLELARRVIREPQIEYDVLYQRFAENEPVTL